MSTVFFISVLTMMLVEDWTECKVLELMSSLEFGGRELLVMRFVNIGLRRRWGSCRICELSAANPILALLHAWHSELGRHKRGLGLAMP